MGPELTREDPEFSIDVVLKSDRARFYNGILCEAESFPPATATWLLTSEDHPNGTDVATLTDKFNLANSGEGMTFTFNATVEMRNLSFEDDGIFTCTVGNGVGEIVTRSFRLRVKCEPSILPDCHNSPSLPHLQLTCVRCGHSLALSVSLSWSPSPCCVTPAWTRS